MSLTGKKNIILPILVLIVISFSSKVTIAFVKTEIKIVEGRPKWLCEKIGKGLTIIIQEINRAAEKKDSLNIELISKYCLENGKITIQRLFNEAGFYTFKKEFRLPLVFLESNKEYEIRGIKVNVELGETKDNPMEYLVFTVDCMGLVKDLKFAMQEKLYRQIMEYGIAEFEQRQIILDFIEKYKRAYCYKDIEYLEKVFADNALIIVGLKLEKASKNGDDVILLEKDSYEYIKRTKDEYIERLRNVIFPRNAFIKVKFKDIEIRKLTNRTVYGVSLKQRWNSSTYSDSGYVFIMYDFENKEPLIRVRTFQSEPLTIEGRIDLSDFQFIKSKSK